jgi:hypothetical protein
MILQEVGDDSITLRLVDVSDENPILGVVNVIGEYFE